MAEEYQRSHEYDTNPTATTNVETTDRGMFDFLGKKKEEEKPQEEVIVTEFEKVTVSEQPEEKKEEHKEEEEAEKKPGLLEKLHRSHSGSSSSSSDEEEVEGGGEKKKKKKGLQGTLRQKIADEKEEERKEEQEDTSVPIEKCDDVILAPPQVEAAHPEEKKGFMEKIKEKLPGHQKKPEEAPIPVPAPAPAHAPAPAECAGEVHAQEGEAKEKKGIFEKIKEKLPGYHKNGEEKKEEPAGGY